MSPSRWITAINRAALPAHIYLHRSFDQQLTPTVVSLNDLLEMHPCLIFAIIILHLALFSNRYFNKIYFNLYDANQIVKLTRQSVVQDHEEYLSFLVQLDDESTVDVNWSWYTGHQVVHYQTYCRQLRSLNQESRHLPVHLAKMPDQVHSL